MDSILHNKNKQGNFIFSLKKRIFFILVNIPFWEKIYLNKIHGFKPLSSCAPAMLKKVFKIANELGTLKKSDYFEFGIYNGGSIIHAQQNAKKLNATKIKFFGFDSFEGLPTIGKKDEKGYLYQGKYACSKENVMNNLINNGGDMHTIKLIEGFFNKSLKKSLIKKYRMRKIAIAYIDCDLYTSTKDVLVFIKNLLIKNSLIIFDDWDISSEKNRIKGGQLAFKEFCKANPNIKFIPEFAFCWHGKVFRVSNI